MLSLGVRPDFGLFLTRGAALVLLAVALWLTLVLGAVVVEALTRGRLRPAARLGCPRRWHAWLLSTVLAVGLGAAPAHAEHRPADQHRHRHETVRVQGPLDGLSPPDRAVDRAAEAAGRPEATDILRKARARTARSASSVVRVRPLDSLWAISKRLLPARAPSARVARLTAALYIRNRDEIGPDPDLIHPGQRLVIPRLTDRTTRDTYSEES